MRVAVFRTYFFLRLCNGNWNLLVSLVRFGSFFVALPSVVVTKFPVPTYYSEKKKTLITCCSCFFFFVFVEWGFRSGSHEAKKQTSDKGAQLASDQATRTPFERMRRV